MANTYSYSIYWKKMYIVFRTKDEFHFLWECPLFKNLRKKFVKKYFWKNTNMLKFIELITSENEAINVC